MKKGRMVEVLLVVFFMSIGRSYALEPTFVWEKSFGGTNDDYGSSVKEISNGGFIVAGTTSSFGAGYNDVYLIKTDSSGNEVWSKTFGGARSDGGYSVEETDDGGFIVTGYSESFGAGNSDVYLIKTDSSGNEVWSRTFGGVDLDRGISVEETRDGGFVITGYTHSFGAGGWDVYLVKTDILGNALWSRTFGGSRWEFGSSVLETTDSNFVVVGFTQSPGAGSYDVYLIKTDDFGNEIWSKTFGGTRKDRGLCVGETADGGFIITGETSSFGAGYNDDDIYLIRTNKDGKELWSQTFGGEYSDTGEAVLETRDGGFIISGTTSSFSSERSDIYIVKVNQFGNHIWSSYWGGPYGDSGKSIVETLDGGFVVTGYTWNDLYLAKFIEPVIETPLISGHPGKFQFASSVGGPNTAPQILSIYNMGIGTLNWRISEDCPWLDVSPTSGSSIGEVDEVTLNVDINDLPTGLYTCNFTILDAVAGNSPVTITVVLSVHVEGKLKVPSEFITIQDAIDAAQNGDTIIVADGTYIGDGNRDIDFLGKAITVRSENGPENCIINCYGSKEEPHNGFYFHSDEDANSILDGFTIVGASLDGIYCEHDSNPTIRNCIISHNAGGGIDCFLASPTIINCVVTNNMGIGIDYGDPFGDRLFRVANCIISNNGGGGIRASTYGLVEIDNCVLKLNDSYSGGGIACGGGKGRREGTYVISNSTIINNIADRGGGIYCYGYSTTVNNCILWGNVATNGPEISFGSSIASVSYTDIQGGLQNVYIGPNCDLNWGQGNINADPCFAFRGYWDANGVWIEDDYHLLAGSPCIDAGEPNYIAEPNETDLDGRPRVIDGRIDMGAYEYKAAIVADVRITPHTINLTGKGNWIMAYIWLPEDYDVGDINPNSIFLNRKIQAESVQLNEQQQIAIAKFYRPEVQGFLYIGQVELSISGWLTNRTGFEGKDIIRVVHHKVGNKPDKYVRASNPNPPDGSTGVGIYADLSWTADKHTTSHDVYFGTGSLPPFVCNQIATTFNPGTMDYETTYYWRIDEVNKWGKTTGELWSFTTIEAPSPPPPPTPPPPP